MTARRIRLEAQKRDCSTPEQPGHAMERILSLREEVCLVPRAAALVPRPEAVSVRSGIAERRLMEVLDAALSAARSQCTLREALLTADRVLPHVDENLDLGSDERVEQLLETPALVAGRGDRRWAREIVNRSERQRSGLGQPRERLPLSAERTDQPIALDLCRSQPVRGRS